MTGSSPKIFIARHNFPKLSQNRRARCLFREKMTLENDISRAMPLLSAAETATLKLPEPLP